MKRLELRRLVVGSAGRVAATVSVLCLVGFLGLSGCSGKTETEEVDPRSELASRGKLAGPIAGPVPTATVDNAVYDFGVMEAGEERGHTFKITNTGEGTLILTPGDPTCKCTSFTVDKKELAPGEVAQAKVTWRPVEVQEKFRQVAPITSNDPDMPQIQLNIHGSVKSIFTIKPDYTWQLGDFKEGEEKEFPGFVFCNVDDKFEITDLKTTNPEITASLEPASDVEVKKANAKSGYLIKLKAGKSLPVGQFLEAVTFKCRASKEAEMRIELKGNRPGPLTIVGKGFVSKMLLWEIGTFDAKKGYKQTLSMFYDDGGSSDLALEGVESDPPGMLVNLKRDENFKGSGTRKRYTADVEIPPGDRALVYNEGKTAMLKLKTNSAEIGSIILRMKFNALVK